MGRPLNKRLFTSTASSPNFIEVTGDVGNGIASGFIVRQKGTREFIVNLQGDIGRVILVDNDSPGVGEAFILMYEDGADGDGTGADFTCDMELTTIAIAAPVAGGHHIVDTLTIVDGAGSSTTAATLQIDSVIPADGGFQSGYTGTGQFGDYAGGANYNTGDVITLVDGTIINVNYKCGKLRK